MRGKPALVPETPSADPVCPPSARHRNGRAHPDWRVAPPIATPLLTGGQHLTMLTPFLLRARRPVGGANVSTIIIASI
jgi:hypothetical protein